MKKNFALLIIIILVGFILSACNIQKPELTLTSEPTGTLLATTTKPSAPTNTPEALATFSLQPANIPEPTLTLSPTATVISALVETKQPTL